MKVKTMLAVFISLKMTSSKLGSSLSVWTGKLGAMACFTALGFLLLSGPALANLLEVKKALEGTLCKKLATDYAKDATAFNVQAIAQLQICLAESLKAKASPGVARNFDIQSPQPSTNRVDSMLPTLPTPPTPPSAIKIR